MKDADDFLWDATQKAYIHHPSGLRRGEFDVTDPAEVAKYSAIDHDLVIARIPGRKPFVVRYTRDSATVTTTVQAPPTNAYSVGVAR